MKIILFLLCLLPASLKAQEWQSLAASAATFTVIDWAQTRYITQHPQFYETNPILGKRPSIGRVNTYFAGALIGGTLLTLALPERDRKWFLGGVTALEVGVTAHNANIGIRVDF